MFCGCLKQSAGAPAPSEQEAPRPAERSRVESERRALSVHHVAGELLARVAEAGLPRASTVAEIEPPVLRGLSADVQCPRDGWPGAAYVDAVSGEDHAGPATHMLSYTWRYSVGAIADSLVAWCRKSGLDPKRVYVWICATCVNQHRVKSRQEPVPFEDFKRTFEGRVRSIGKVVALMMPWHAPAYLERSWCMLELHTAIQLGQACELTVLMPPDQETQFTSEIINGDGLDRIWRALVKASIMNATASVEEDKHHILQLVQEGAGVAKFNEHVKDHLKRWFLQAAYHHVQTLPQKMLESCSKVGKMMGELGDLDSAQLILEFGWENRDIVHSPNLATKVDAAVIAESRGEMAHERAWLLHRQGKRAEAVQIYSHGLEDMASRGIVQGLALSKLHRGRGRALIGDESDELFIEDAEHIPSAEQIAVAIADYERALCIMKQLGLLESEDGAKLYNNLGIAKTLVNNFEEAAAALQQAEHVRAKTDTLEGPGNASRLTSLGSLHLKRGRHLRQSGGDAQDVRRTWDAARDAFEKAARLLRASHGSHRMLAKIEHRLGWLEAEQVADVTPPGPSP